MHEIFHKVYQLFDISRRITLHNVSFSSLRVAEQVLEEGMLIKEYPEEAYKIKNLDDSMAVLAKEGGQERLFWFIKLMIKDCKSNSRFEAHLRSWMKSITDLLQEGEQLRLETDDQGPQDEIEYWKAKAAHLTLLVDQMMCPPTKLTLVTLRNFMF